MARLLKATYPYYLPITAYNALTLIGLYTLDSAFALVGIQKTTLKTASPVLTLLSFRMDHNRIDTPQKQTLLSLHSIISYFSLFRLLSQPTLFLVTFFAFTALNFGTSLFVVNTSFLSSKRIPNVSESSMRSVRMRLRSREKYKKQS